MPPAKSREEGHDPALPEVGGGDGIDALPDSVLEHIAGFLPAEDAVRTSVLARRWRHLWKSATGLRITGRGNRKGGPASVKALRDFVYRLLLLRGGSPLDTCEISFSGFRHADVARVIRFGDDFHHDDVPCIILWVQHVLLCKARVLRLDTVLLDDLPLVSRHLMRLELAHVVLKTSFCNFMSCPSLEHLEIVASYLRAEKISSESLKSLRIKSCGFNLDQGFRALIYVPSLVSLSLDGQKYRTPVLDSMPSLQEAFVRLTAENADCCRNADFGDCDDENCFSCHGIEHDRNNSCVLLDGLSKVENLALIAESRTFIFKRDLKQCPTFSKLKTLLLNDYWCVAPGFHELTCILKHSPVLEKLTLQLFSKGPKHKLRMKGSRVPTEMSAAISEHLKIVEVKCDVVDRRAIKVFKFLSTFNIRFSLDEVEILED